jgi:hypothetical protein
MVRRLQLTDKSFYASSTGRQFSTAASDEKFQPQADSRPQHRQGAQPVSFFRALLASIFSRHGRRNPTLICN